MPEIFLSIGSNLEPELHIPAVIEELRAEFGRVEQSSTYESAPVGFDGPPFHNLVVGFQSEREPLEIQRLLKELEALHGRTREGDRFLPRTLDLDLLLYGDSILETGNLRLPREDITRYAFVLEPLAEIAPRHRHPVTEQTYQALWDAYDKAGVAQVRIIPASSRS